MVWPYLDLFRTAYKFAVVGLLSNVIGFSLYCAVTWIGVPPLVAMTALYCIGALVGYFGNSRWTFQTDGNSMTQFFKYTVVQVGGYAINSGLLLIFYCQLNYPHEIVQAIAIFIVAAYLFITLRLVVFPQMKRV